jgi:hypothetical protein
MRVALDWGDAPFRPAGGDEAELEMHDGARFRVTVVEPLAARPDGGGGEFRMKLLGRGGGR